MQNDEGEDLIMTFPFDEIDKSRFKNKEDLCNSIIVEHEESFSALLF